MNRKLRIAVIGAGQIGRHHMEAIRRCPRAQLVAIADTSRPRLAEAAERFGVAEQFVDHRRLLARGDVDAVSIALPNHLHASVAIDALKAGKHVHLDKPIAMNARQAAGILAVAKKARRVFMVGQNQRFTRDTQLLKQFIDRGALGEIYHARAWWIRRGGIPRIGSVFPAKIYRRRGNHYEVIAPERMKLKYPEDRLHHFADCVLDGQKPLVSPEQSLVVQKILDAIYKSAQTGREVRL